MTLGERIQKYRKKVGMSQEELANRLNVTRQSISLWETDQTVPSLDSLLIIAKIFDISLDELCVRESLSTENDKTVANTVKTDVDSDTREADEKKDSVAYCETQYTKSLIKRANRLSIQKLLISFIAAIAASVILGINILLTDGIQNILVFIPIFAIIVFVSILISIAVRNKKILAKNAKENFSNLCRYWFYNDHIDIEVSSKDAFSKLSVKYADIKKTKEDNDYYFIFINNLIYAIDKNNLNDNISTIARFIKTTDVDSTVTNKTHTSINMLLLIMFVLSILSLFIALFVVVIFIKTSPLPEFGMSMVEYMWTFFLVIPIPLTSTILGIVFLRKNYKCKKNIIAGIIMCILLSIFGCLTFAFKDQIRHDFQYVNDIENTINIDLPNSGYVSYQIVKTDGQNKSSNGMVKFENASEIYNTVKNDRRFKTNTDAIPSNYVNSYDLAATQNYDYFMLFDVTCLEANNVIYSNHDGHRFIYLAYNVETNILYVVDFVKY